MRAVRFFFIFVWVIAGCAFGASYFVNDSSTAGDLSSAPWCPTPVAGQDIAGCGSCALPCASLAGAFARNSVLPGDTVYVNTGVYRASGAGDFLSLSLSGTKSAPIRIQGAAGPSGSIATLDGNHVANGCLYIAGGKWITVSDLNCINTAQDAGLPGGNGIYVDGPADGIVLERLFVATDGGWDGIDSWATDGGTLTIDGCEVTASNSGIFVRGNTVTTVISNNRVHTVAAVGIQRQLGPVGSVTWITGNTIYDTALTAGFSPLGIYQTDHAEVWNNTVFTTNQSAIYLSASGATIENNTVHDNTVSAVRATSCGSQPILIRNNILFGTNTQPVMQVQAGCNVTSDYNDLFTTGGGTLVSWNGTAYTTLAAYQAASGMDTHSLSVDPLFADATNAVHGARNYHPRSTAGFFADGGWTQDATAFSPTIDAADPLAPFANEPGCNGGRLNLGSYGNTATASMSFTGCPDAGSGSDAGQKSDGGMAFDGGVGDGGTAAPVALSVGCGCSSFVDGAAALLGVWVAFALRRRKQQL